MNMITDKIREIASETPNSICLRFDNKEVTYGQLEYYSSIVCENLRRIICNEHETFPGGSIALLMSHTPELYFAQVGAMKLGVPFLPLSDDYPPKRISDCISDSGCKLLITDGLLSVIAKENVQIINISDLLTPININESLPEVPVSAPAVIIYTSGSTGKPKGIVHSIQAVTALVNDGMEGGLLSPLFCPQRNTMLITRPGFVACLKNYSSICSKGTACIPSKEDFNGFSHLQKRIASENITGLFATPSFVKNMLTNEFGHNIIACIQVLGLGAEKIDKDLIEKIQTINSDIKIIAEYGCSETCGPCVYYAMNEDYIDGLVGKPSAGTVMTVVDEDGNTLLHGETGEVILSGGRITGDYIGHAKGSGGFTKMDGENAFRTGDFGYIDPDGNLVLSGRRDDMVKYHGQRVELSDIASAVSEYQGILLCHVLLKKGGKDDFLCAVFTASEEIDIKALRIFLSSRLPEYMIPGMYRQLPEMPLNASGKIDRVRLKEMDFESKRIIEDAATETESLVAKVFAEALDLREVGVNEDFFELGGTSLGLARLVTALGEKGMNIVYSDINNYSTPRELAQYYDSVRDSLPDLTMDKERYPLTATQYGVFREVGMGTNGETYSIPYIMKAADGIGTEALSDAVVKVVNAHPGMKYVIREDENSGNPYMYMMPEMEIPCPVLEGPAKDRMDAVRNFKKISSVKGNPLFHFAVYKTDEGCFLLMKTHMIFQDATSTKVIISELNRVLGGKDPLGENYLIQQQALYEEHRTKQGYREKSRNYFRELFRDMTDNASLESDLKGELTPGQSINCRFDSDELSYTVVREYCEKLHISESTFFTATLGLLLSKYLYRDKVSFSFVYNGRSNSNSQRTVGTLIRRIPVCMKFQAGQSCAGYLKDVGRQMMSSMSNDMYTFDEALKELPVNEDVEFLFQGSMFTDDVNMVPESEFIKGDPFFVENYHTGMVTGCLSIALFSTGRKYTLTVEYRNERFSKGWVKDFANRFFMVALGLLSKGNVGDISIISDSDLAVIEKSNDTCENTEFVPVSQQISDNAKLNPDKPAIICRDFTLSYGDLDFISDNIAGNLKWLGIGRGKTAAIIMNRDSEYILTEIGILKANAAFIPFAADCPLKRLSDCLTDICCDIIITSEELLPTISPALPEGCTGITLKELTTETEHTEASPVSGSDLAYIIFTSGSTGKPKGVMIEHGALANYVLRSKKSPEIMHYGNPDRVCLALAAFSFDVSIVETFVPLCNGGTVCLATEEEIHNPLLLRERILSAKADTMTCTPTFLQNLLGIDDMREAISSITLFDIGAEAFSVGLYRQLRTLRPDSIILNVYGPTECTMGCTANVVEREDDLSIGRPNLNTTVYVADVFGNPLPRGIKGELIIGGIQVARGYAGNDEKTAEAFFEKEGIRFYKSGDIVSWNEEGKLYIYGRKDSQVKLHGYRIELEEINRAVTALDGVKNAVVLIKEYRGAQVLAAYYTANSDIDSDLAKSILRKRLPHYMVPSVFVRADSLEMNSSGKLDVSKLKALSLERSFEKKAPETKEEKLLCFAFSKALNMDIDEIGITDDFFELGGDSLRAMIVAVNAKELSLSVPELYQQRTIEKILKNKQTQKKLSMDEIIEIDKKAKKQRMPLTPMQYLFLDKSFMFLSSQATLISGLEQLDNSVDEKKFCHAINQVLHHFSAFATIITTDFSTDDFCMEYKPDEVKDIHVEYLSEEEFELINSTLSTPIPVTNSLLFKIRLFRTEKNTYLFLSISHIIVDAQALFLINKYIYMAYAGQELPLDLLYYYFEDMRQKRIGKYAADADKYYSKMTSGVDWCIMPAFDLDGNKRPAGVFSMPLDIPRDDRMQFLKKYNCSGNILSIISMALAVADVESERNIMITWAYDNRTDNIRKDIFGPLVASHTIFFRLDEYKSVAEMAEDVRSQFARCISIGDYWSELKTYVPYYNEIMFVNYMYIGNNASQNDTHFVPKWIPVSDSMNQAILNLGFNVIETKADFELIVDYNSGAFSEEKIKHIAELFETKMRELTKGTVFLG